MSATLQRFVSSGVLMIWGGVLGYFYFSGRVVSYLHPAFHIYTMLSSIVLAALAVAFLLIRPPQDSGTCHGSRSLLGQIFSAFVLTAPLLTAVVISPSEFGATAVMNRGFVQDINELPAFSPPQEPALPNAEGNSAEEMAMDPASYLTRNEKGQIQAETIDLLYAASEPTLREDFENKEVEIMGQFLPAKSGNAHGDRFHLVRMFVMCCAADARPIGVAVEADKTLSFPEMTWLKITGKAIFPIENGRRNPVILADSVTEIDPPDQTFVY